MRYVTQAQGTEALAGRKSDPLTKGEGRNAGFRTDRVVRRNLGWGPRPLPGRPKPIGLTGAQRLRQWRNEAFMALNDKAMASPLWDGEARSGKSTASRLRELELHPERLDAIRARP